MGSTWSRGSGYGGWRGQIGAVDCVGEEGALQLYDSR